MAWYLGYLPVALLLTWAGNQFHGRKVDVSTKPKKAFIAELGMQQPTTESR